MSVQVRDVIGVTENKRMNSIEKDDIGLEDLPNEILLKIFENLDIHDIFQCGQVSKRIRSIAQHEPFWQKVYLKCFHVYSSELIQMALESGCKHLTIDGG